MITGTWRIGTMKQHCALQTFSNDIRWRNFEFLDNVFTFISSFRLLCIGHVVWLYTLNYLTSADSHVARSHHALSNHSLESFFETIQITISPKVASKSFRDYSVKQQSEHRINSYEVLRPHIVSCFSSSFEKILMPVSSFTYWYLMRTFLHNF